MSKNLAQENGLPCTRDKLFYFLILPLFTYFIDLTGRPTKIVTSFTQVVTFSLDENHLLHYTGLFKVQLIGEEMSIVHIVGGGLAGSEAAWQCLQAGYSVHLHEMRPKKMTEAHKTSNLAELVCSNTLKSERADSPAGQLKYEMSRYNSLIISAAYHAKIPAGQALGVNREVFSAFIMSQLCLSEKFHLIRDEVISIPSQEELEKSDDYWIIASGPLTSSELATQLQNIAGQDKFLFFYDAIAPIFSGDSIDYDQCFWGNRYDETSDDYLNIPLDEPGYLEFVNAIKDAEKTPLHDFESTPYFESCLPIEVMVERGLETPRFGPLKPVGFTDPKTGKRPWAVIQLRREDRDGSMMSMVGFQTKMKISAQNSVFRLLPGMKNAEFLRYGSVHRNTYLNSPECLNGNLSFKNNNRVFLAGQISGVEGYTESAAMGLLAGRFVLQESGKKEFTVPSVNTIIGSLLNYVTKGSLGRFQPMNTNFGLLLLDDRCRKMRKDKKREYLIQRAVAEIESITSAENELFIKPVILPEPPNLQVL